ncbi:MAG: PIN domain-containing protein [Thermoanaerobaculia bacterium]
MRFVDTNVLLYGLSRDPAEREKAERARGLLTARDLVLSVQVLQEFYVQATRASRADRLRHDQAVRLVESFCRYPVQDLTLGVVRAALATRERWRLSYWDAAILEAARASRCEIVLSEDLSDGTDYDGVRVENPFRGMA